MANFVKECEIKKLVLASTSSIYGNSGTNKMVEGVDEKIEPPSIYAASKLSGEVFAKNILEDTDSNVIITRFKEKRRMLRESNHLPSLMASQEIKS